MISDDQLQSISRVVATYEALSPAKRKAHQETEVRTNFIDPLFTALGWPMDDREHVERETSVVDSKRPDYIFKLNGVPHLFLEAKRFTEEARALQWAADAISKAYNKGVGWAAVTNFTDLVVYDAYELLPPATRPRTVIDLTYDRYADPDSLLHELSPSSLQQRLMEKRAQEAGIRTRTIPIEKRLYESMRDWREMLINDMALYNKWQTEDDYAKGDEAVQRLIDRLLFLRHCEDRGITDPDLRSLFHGISDSGWRGGHVTPSLLRLFADAAKTFDSEIFQTDALIDVQFRALEGKTDFDNTLADVIKGLYSVPLSLAEYDFSQMDADILGQVYQQYLGHVAQRTRRFTAAQPSLPDMPSPAITVEAKRQRRRERGIYYTPAWVVRYIVDQTIGRFLEEHKNDPDAIENLTIVDPACGSGSFLIRAYETLLEHHAQQVGGDVGHLDTRTRERILRRNIYGVDSDPQAIEIARLNLLIRMVREQEPLPELAPNIKVGNSLIEGDEAALRPFFGDGWEEHRPFNWQGEFPDISARGGFDVIIGNPPYGYRESQTADLKGYYRSAFSSVYGGSFDVFQFFLQRGVDLLRPGGHLGMIVSNTFLSKVSGKELRKYLLKELDIEEILSLGQHAFTEPTVETVVFTARKKNHLNGHRAPAINTKIAQLSHDGKTIAVVSASDWSPNSYAQGTQRIFPLSRLPFIEKMEAANVPLATLVEMSVGINTGNKGVRDAMLSRTPQNDAWKHVLLGRDVSRYSYHWNGWWVAYDPALIASFGKLGRTLPPKEFFDRPKILIQRTRRGLKRKLNAAYDDREVYVLNRLTSIILGDSTISLHYLLGLLNSKLLDYYFQHKFTEWEVKPAFLKLLPIAVPEPPSTACETADQVATLARRMLTLHQRLGAKGDVHDNEREVIEREIATTDREIDNLVYDLYGLTRKDRALIESEASAI